MINKKLYNKAILLNICEKVQREWNRTLTEQQLIDLWYANYDFALINHYPTNVDIKECFNQELLRRNNVLVDDVWSLLNPAKAMILGNSESNIRFNAYNAGQVWVRDRSRVNVYVRDNANITVCVMDNAEVSIVSYSPTAKVLVMKYSPAVKLSTVGAGIKVRENYKYLQKG